LHLGQSHNDAIAPITIHQSPPLQFQSHNGAIAAEVR